MPEIFQYEFMNRAIVASVLVGATAPAFGVFLVLRRLSLMADTLSHVALAGVAVALLTKTFAPAVALVTTTAAAVSIEELRMRRLLPGDAALAVFLYGALAGAGVLISIAEGFNSTLFSYLFGSVLTVSTTDLWWMAILAVVIALFMVLFSSELAQVTLDAYLAKINGVRVHLLNLGLAVLTGATITVSMRVVGLLLVAVRLNSFEEAVGSIIRIDVPAGVLADLVDIEAAAAAGTGDTDDDRGDTADKPDEQPAGPPRNFLIIGTDSAIGLDLDDPASHRDRTTGVALADVIMLLRLDPGLARASLVSLPRDLYVPIYRDGILAGRITSGSFGHTIGRSVGLGYVETTDVAAAKFITTAPGILGFHADRSKCLATVLIVLRSRFTVLRLRSRSGVNCGSSF